MPSRVERRCTQCGELSAEGNRFCERCGTELPASVDALKAEVPGSHEAEPVSDEPPSRDSVGHPSPGKLSWGVHRSAVPRTKICPECAEKVKGAAVVCRYCGHDFRSPPPRIHGSRDSRSDSEVATVREPGPTQSESISLQTLAPESQQLRGAEQGFSSVLGRVLLLVAGLVIAMAPGMPWQNAREVEPQFAFPGILATGFGGVGGSWKGQLALFVGLVASALALAILLRRGTSLDGHVAIAALFAGVTTGFVFLDAILEISRLNDLGPEDASVRVFVRPGLWILLVGAIAAFASGVILLRSRPQALVRPWWREKSLYAAAVPIIPLTVVAFLSRFPADLPERLQAAAQASPQPTASVNLAAEECGQTVARWLDDIAQGYEDLGSAAFQLGIESPEYPIIEAAYSEYAARAFQVGAEEAARGVINEVIIPMCEEAHP